MKAIIYAGIGLFSVATVYGVVDYYSTQKKGTLDNLYKEQEEMPVEQEKTIVNNNVIPVNVVEKSSTVINAVPKAIRKLKLRKRTIRLEDFSRGRIVEPMPVEVAKSIQPVKEEPKKIEEPKPVDATITAVSTVADTKKEPERKLSLDMFSRAPLRDPAKFRKPITFKDPLKKDKETKTLKIN